MIGVGCVVHANTGLVIDSMLQSTHCQTCATNGEYLKKINPKRYETQLHEHKKEECDIGYTGKVFLRE